MKSRIVVTIGLLSILLGLGLGTPVLMPQLFATQPATAASNPRPTPVEEPLISGQPVHIEFPRLKISLPVAPGTYDAKANTWSVSKDKAHFATTTSEPNNKTGNTFIYGHNRWQVFTGLLNAQLGDTAVVTTSNGHTFTYTLRSIVDTNPNDTSYMKPTTEPTLTVQTCSGFRYENRRMLSFELKEVN